MRDYDPTTGRYIQADPLGLVDGASVYGYVGQSPLKWIDPTGLVRHVTGRWIQCGANCRIRIDRSYVGGRWTRHLHWECRGSEGVCGEDGAASHGQTWADAPRAVRECAIRNGFGPGVNQTQSMLSAGELLFVVGGVILIIVQPEIGGAIAVAAAATN